MPDPRTLVVPKAGTPSVTLEELKQELLDDGATGVQRDLGPGGAGLYPCMGTAGVYVVEGEKAEAGLNTDTYLIEEGWPGDLEVHTTVKTTPHHLTVHPHTVAPAGKRLATQADGPIYNLASHVKQAEIGGFEYDMLVDGMANDPMDSIQLGPNTGLVRVFNQPVHLLETLAGVFDPAAAAHGNPAWLYWSGDTTTGSDGSWQAIHSHVYDFKSDPDQFIDDVYSPTRFPPLMTNLPKVKGVMIIGNGVTPRYLVEWKVWIPK